MTEKKTFVGRLGDTSKAEGKMARIGVARVGAEMISMSVALGSLALCDSLLRQPLEPTRRFVAKNVVEPFLPQFEWVGGNLPSLQTPEATAELQAMTSKDRAKSYADTLVNYSLALAAGVYGQMKGQALFDYLTGVPRIGDTRQLKVAFVDRSIQFGSIVLLNTMLAKPSIETQKGIASVLEKQFGLDPEKAKENANYFVNWHLPNVAGALGAVGKHFQMSKDLIWK